MTALLTPVRDINLAGRPAFTASDVSFWDSDVALMDIHFESQFTALEIPETSDSTFLVWTLESDSPDGLIISELGGEEKVETQLAYFLDFLTKSKGSSEVLVFYLRGKWGNLWAVYAGWNIDDHGWRLNAYPTSRSAMWLAGVRIIAPKVP